MQSRTFNATHWLYAFISIHLFAWTVVPALVRWNLPLDSIEGTIWGHQLEWGYDKNPFLNGWLTALAGYFSQPSGWMIYFFSQLSVVICFFAVWQIAKKMLPSTYALISILLLEGIQYFNFHAIDFNDNTLELGLWALATYFFYVALRTPTYRAWIFTGIFAALGVMAKYYTTALLAGMALFLLLDKNNRRQLITIKPYIGLITFLFIISPHTIWLFYHDFITVTYVFERANSTPSWTNHLFFPLQFAWQQLEAFLPALLLFSFLFIGKKSNSAKFTLTQFDKAFLFYVGLGPFLLTILLSIIFGIKLRAGWGMPLQSLWGIILVAAIQPAITETKIKNFIIMIFMLMGLLLTGYAYSLIYSKDTSSANFPGREMAAYITQEWNKKYHTKLEYVAGSRWIGGNIGFYSTDHPAVFIEWDNKRAPWINTEEMKKKGAIFVWDITDNETLPLEVKQQFPTLSQPMIMEFDWKRNYYGLEPAKIGVAFLPPQKARHKG
ncbi:MAG: undecaprenyl-phosphomannose:protein mannosyltransferase [uncultured bacterium]|nr:MAG: undecaprenyl-phosphomannose:protein mannosyltransferase [uncultured bacterium]